MADTVPKAVDEMVECVEGLFPAAKLVFSGKDNPETRTLITQELKKVLSLVSTALAVQNTPTEQTTETIPPSSSQTTPPSSTTSTPPTLTVSLNSAVSITSPTEQTNSPSPNSPPPAPSTSPTPSS